MNLPPSLERSCPVLPPLAREDLDQVLQGTLSCWEEARGQTLFIAGGTGFFGLWLLESFAAANDRLKLGARAVVLARHPEVLAQKAPHLLARADLEFIAGDVRTFPFPSGRYPLVIHAATPVGTAVGAAETREILDIIVGGTRRMLEFAAHSGARKFLLTSSGAVYGGQPTSINHLTEDGSGVPGPPLPVSAYGEGKRLAEQLCMDESRRAGFEAKVARCFAFVGPHLPLDGQFAIGNFIRDALSGKAIRVLGDGTSHRSYLYATDLAVWLWTILFRGASARAYNVGSRDAVSIAQLATLVGTILGSPHPVQIAEPAVLGQAPSRYVPEVQRAAAELGLRQTVPLAEAIRRTANWWRAATPTTPI